MSVSSFKLYDQDGRVRGHYVYMLLCQDAKDSPIYIKIGETENPIKRFRTLRGGCPVAPKSFAYFDTRTKPAARRVEAQLHLAFHEWNTHLEWFRFDEAEKARFNKILSHVLNAEMNGKPVAWNKVSINDLIKIGDRGKRYAQLLFATRGPAYQDFTKDQR